MPWKRHQPFSWFPARATFLIDPLWKSNLLAPSHLKATLTLRQLRNVFCSLANPWSPRTSLERPRNSGKSSSLRRHEKDRNNHKVDQEPASSQGFPFAFRWLYSPFVFRGVLDALLPSPLLLPALSSTLTVFWILLKACSSRHCGWFNLNSLEGRGEFLELTKTSWDPTSNHFSDRGSICLALSLG